MNAKEEFLDFDWDTPPGNGLVHNPNIKTSNSEDKIYSRESYAQELYDLMEGKEVITKDLVDQAVYEVEVNGQYRDELSTSVGLGGQEVFINLEKEKGFLKKINFDVDKIVLGTKLKVLVSRARDGSYTGSVEKGYRLNLKRELLREIEDRKSAYNVNIMEVNDGGFIVNLSGLKCFMPGSLSAANKITNFESMLGKEVYVMIESYLESSDMFVVSNKRYIKTILPERVKKLEYDKKYTGKITGCAPYGCFVEWDEIFTGLIHTSEMDPDLSLRMKEVRSGEEVEFWIKEIKDPNRIILTQKGPDPMTILYKEFKEEYEGDDFSGKIKDMKNFGIFIELEEGIVGMMPPREFKKYRGKYEEGDIIDVYVKKVEPGEKKIYLRHINDGIPEQY